MNPQLGSSNSLTMFSLPLILTVFQIIRGTLGIYGGDTAKIEDHRHEVILEFENGGTCGGSIISAHYLITSAFCAYETTKTTIIRAGSSWKGHGGTEHSIEEVIIHDDWNESNHKNDIAIIRVLEPFRYKKYQIRAIPLFYRHEDILPGTWGQVSGWGMTDLGMAKRLYSLNVTVVDHEECKNLNSEWVHEGVICAGSGQHKAVCQGDGGDPLVIDGRLAGVQFWYWAPCDKKSPTGYVKIGYYRDWIDEHVEY